MPNTFADLAFALGSAASKQMGIKEVDKAFADAGKVLGYGDGTGATTQATRTAAATTPGGQTLIRPKGGASGFARSLGHPAGATVALGLPKPDEAKGKTGFGGLVPLIIGAALLLGGRR